MYLTGCEAITAKGLRAFSGHQTLESLMLFSCYKFSWEDVESVALTCVRKVSYYDADNIVLKLVPEYPVVLDKRDENGPDNSLYKDYGSLQIKFAALADVRSLKQSNSDAVKSVSNGVNQTAQVDEKNTASNLTSSSNGDGENISKHPSP
ncbi:hypothetical protein SSX86_031109, partial [Deinandra increscens subsp. villosa]